MKHFAWAAVAFFLSVGVAPAHDRSSAPVPPAARQTAPQAPLPGIAYHGEMAEAQGLMVAKDYEHAIQIYANMIRENPGNSTVWNMMGVALQQTGQIDSARSAYARATKLNPKFAEAYNNIGTTWYQEQKYGKALRAYQKSIAVNPNLASAYSNMGCAYFSVKKYPLALDAFNKALALDPDVFLQSNYAGSVLQDRSVTDHGTFYFLLAKSYAERNDAATCAEYLLKSFDEGYKNIATVKTDPSFAKVLTYPGVQAVLDKADANANAAAKVPPSAPRT